MSNIRILHGDNLELLKQYPDNYFDSVVTDSPYGLGKEPNPVKLIQDWIDHGYHEVKGKGFMGKSWDAFVPQPALWKECYRVLKPGGYLLSFFGTRTYDWGTLAIRLAGFEIRDCIQWIYGNGFPKSKACLKPANEPICVARKPGPLQMLNIDECRISGYYVKTSERGGMKQSGVCYGTKKNPTYVESHPDGRWPANVILDELAAEIMDEQSGIRVTGSGRKGEPGKRAYLKTDASGEIFNGSRGLGLTGKVEYDENGNPFVFNPAYNSDSVGGASRFFYVAKASPGERNAGLEHLEKNSHPTVKPISLMRQLIRLYTAKGGICLDLFAGSGTTGCAAALEGIDIVLMERESDYIPLIEGRIKHWQKVANK